MKSDFFYLLVLGRREKKKGGKGRKTYLHKKNSINFVLNRNRNAEKGLRIFFLIKGGPSF